MPQPAEPDPYRSARPVSSTGSMRAAVVRAPGEVVLVERPTPRVGPGQALIRVASVSLCGTDLRMFAGHAHSRIRLPTTPGHEFGGTVTAVGPGVTIPIGTPVAVESNISCGECRWCREGRDNICTDYRVFGESEMLPGACAEYVLTPADRLHELPPEVPVHLGALVQPLAIAMHAVDRANLPENPVVAIVGAGPIGLGVAMIAKARGARTIVVDIEPRRLEFARRIGADVVVDATESDAAEWAVEHAPSGIHACFEAVGGEQSRTFTDAVAAVGRGGRIVVIGSFSIPDLPLPVRLLKYGELEIVGTQGHPGTYPGVIDLMRVGGLAAQDLVTHRLPLSQIADAYRLLSDKSLGAMVVLLEP